MKVKFKFFCCLLLAAGLVACSQKEEPIVPEEEITPSTEETDGEFSYVFKVGNPETKTTFDTDHVAWNADDLMAAVIRTLPSAVQWLFRPVTWSMLTIRTAAQTIVRKLMQ